MTSSNFEQLVEDMFAAYDAEQWLLTQALAQKLVDADPSANFARCILGEAQSVLANPLAESTLLEGVKLAGNKKRLALTTLGNHYERRMDVLKARKAYLEGANFEPEHATSYIYLGSLESSLGNLDAAEAAYLKGTRCKSGPLDEAWYNLATVAARRGNFIDALAMLDSSLAIDPSYELAVSFRREVEALIALQGK